MSQYDGEKRYKLAYRYHVQALSDVSKTAVAGADIKDGWRLVGEPDSTQASDSGLVFYKNKTPQIKFDGVIFSKNSVNGKKDVKLSAEDLKNTVGIVLMVCSCFIQRRMTTAI